MRIILPENISDITLGQYQRYMLLENRTDLTEFEFEKRKIEIFTGLNRKDIANVRYSDYAEILVQIDKALNQSAEFVPTFKIKDVEFGFVPNLDKITTGEYVDMKKYDAGVDTLHNLMAILFRPIKKKDSFNNYSIIEYQGAEQYANIMKQMPLSIVNGALVFFWNLANELTNYTQRFMEVEQAKEKSLLNTLKSGDGMVQSLN
jgi:hypothetical protein